MGIPDFNGRPALIVGNVTQIADLYHGSTRSHFGQHIVGAAYLFHGSSRNVAHGSPTYAVTMQIDFRCNVGTNCTGRLNAKWTWLVS